MSDRRKVLPQYLLPKRGLTAFAGRVASRERGATTTRLVRWFVRKYGVDMSEAVEPEIAAYASFNDFFTRALRDGARPLADADLVCPVDGAISQFGEIEHDQILQAKGHRYSTTALVGGDPALAAQFHDGSFATLYLSPKDYHRIHMPCDGMLTRMIYVPGALFSVNPTTARGVPGLFARNERVVCVFESSARPLRADAGGRDHRRQHGHRLARHGQSRRAPASARMALSGRPGGAEKRRGNGPLHARLDRGAAVRPDAGLTSIRSGSRAARSASAKRWRALAPPPPARRGRIGRCALPSSMPIPRCGRSPSASAPPCPAWPLVRPSRHPAGGAARGDGRAGIAVIDHTALPIEVARRCTGLTDVVFLGTGARSYMDPEALAGIGIAVHIIKGYGDTAVAECAIGLLFAAARGFAAMDRGMRAGQWLRTEGMQLAGKTLGLLGFGGIAAEAARMAAGIGMRVLAWNRTPKSAPGVEFVRSSAAGRERRGLAAPAADRRDPRLPLRERIAAMRRGRCW